MQSELDVEQQQQEMELALKRNQMTCRPVAVVLVYLQPLTSAELLLWLFSQQFLVGQCLSDRTNCND